jgi:ABC-type phosphate transport system permease subunit
MVGILLFVISLVVNAAVRWFTRRLEQQRG